MTFLLWYSFLAFLLLLAVILWHGRIEGGRWFFLLEVGRFMIYTRVLSERTVRNVNALSSKGRQL